MPVGQPITLLGKTYRSRRQAAQALGISESALARRMAKGESPEEAHANLLASKSRSSEGKSIVYGGKSFPNLAALAEAHGLNYPALRWYLLKGTSLDEAVQEAAEGYFGGMGVAGLPPKK